MAINENEDNSHTFRLPLQLRHKTRYPFGYPWRQKADGPFVFCEPEETDRHCCMWIEVIQVLSIMPVSTWGIPTIQPTDNLHIFNNEAAKPGSEL